MLRNGADRNLAFLWHDGSVDNLARAPRKLDMATSLTGFHEAGCLKPSLDFAEG
jgi:hypothetical protein